VAPPCEPVYVESYEPEEKLPLPERPVAESNQVDAEEIGWREWLIMFGQDHLKTLGWALELEHIIRSHNEAIPEPN
jgi:hypothetical protein